MTDCPKTLHLFDVIAREGRKAINRPAHHSFEGGLLESLSHALREERPTPAFWSTPHRTKNAFFQTLLQLQSHEDMDLCWDMVFKADPEGALRFSLKGQPKGALANALTTCMLVDSGQRPWQFSMIQSRYPNDMQIRIVNDGARLESASQNVPSVRFWEGVAESLKTPSIESLTALFSNPKHHPHFLNEFLSAPITPFLASVFRCSGVSPNSPWNEENLVKGAIAHGTLIHRATFVADVSTVKFLLEEGADPAVSLRFTRRDGTTLDQHPNAASYARSLGKEQIAAMFEAHVAKSSVNDLLNGLLRLAPSP